MLRLNNRLFPCTLGRNGITTVKREGDGATPRTICQINRVWWRHDRGSRPQTLLPLHRIQSRHGWCDDPAHPRYNTLVHTPFASSHEELHRKDHLYDLIIELSYNTHPVQRYRGSAIFMHLLHPDGTPTAGCIALNSRHLRFILSHCSSRTQIHIG